jgi:hypothetical protein
VNRKDRRKEQSQQSKKFRLIKGGKVDRSTLAKAVCSGQDDGGAPAKRLSEALAMLLAAWEEHDQQLTEDRRCSAGDKFAVLLNLAANFGIQIEVPYEQFLDAASIAYDQQEKQLGRC